MIWSSESSLLQWLLVYSLEDSMSNSIKGLGSHLEIGSDHVLWHTLQQVWVFIAEGEELAIIIVVR